MPVTLRLSDIRTANDDRENDTIVALTPRRPHRTGASMWLRYLTVFAAAALVAGCTGLIEDGLNSEGGGNGSNGSDYSPDDFDEDNTFVAPDLDPEKFDVTSDPGTRTLQRLNNVEYENTLHDLLGVEIDAHELFPTDDRGYGFDNIADVLSLSTVHIEMYERTADEAVTAAIFESPAETDLWIFPADAPDVTASTGATTSDGWNLWSNGTLTTIVNLPTAGRYRLATRARQTAAGNEDAQMEFVVDGATVHTVNVAATSLTGFETEVQIGAGPREIGVGFTNDFYDPDAGADRNLVVESITIEGPLDVAPTENPLRAAIVTCDLDANLTSCSREIIANFGLRAWRRPLTETEVERLAQFVDLAISEGDDAATGIELALQAMLLSPHFLFKVELDEDPDLPVVHELSNYELATRLSYFIWSSTPDQELLDAAAAGTLQDDATLAAQVERMMADPKAESLVENFAGQWLHLRAIDEAVPDAWYYPDWTEELRADMKTELEMVFRNHFLGEDRNMQELLTGSETYVNERLASHYGISGVTGDEFQPVSLMGTLRSGWITSGALMTTTAYATRTSPVRRGAWVLENMLCRTPPPPPAGVEGIPEDNTGTLTLREQMERHRSDPVCATCHAEMDPIGFAFENFDGIGAYRSEDSGQPIDAAGSLPSGAEFNGPVELGRVLADDPDFATCVIEKTMTFAIGRGPTGDDTPYHDEIAEAYVAGDYRLSELVAEVVTSEPFRLRRGSLVD